MEIKTPTTKEAEDFSLPNVSLLQSEEEEIEELYSGVGDKEVFSTPTGKSVVSKGEEETAVEEEVVEEEKEEEEALSQKEEEEE